MWATIKVLLKDSISSRLNNINITFDNTVVEDVSTMDKLANKVADIITPVIQNALNNNVQYNYN